MAVKIVPSAECPACRVMCAYLDTGVWVMPAEKVAADVRRYGCCGAHKHVLHLTSEEDEYVEGLSRGWDYAAGLCN